MRLGARLAQRVRIVFRRWRWPHCSRPFMARSGSQDHPTKWSPQIWTALCGVPISETKVKDAKRRGGGPDKLQASVACFTFEDEAFARALLSWRIDAWDVLKELCKPGSQAAMRVETIVDLVLLEDARTPSSTTQNPTTNRTSTRISSQTSTSSWTRCPTGTRCCMC